MKRMITKKEPRVTKNIIIIRIK